MADKTPKKRPDGSGGHITLTPSKKLKGKAFKLTWDEPELTRTAEQKKKIKTRKANKVARKARKRNR